MKRNSCQFGNYMRGYLGFGGQIESLGTHDRRGISQFVLFVFVALAVSACGVEEPKTPEPAIERVEIQPQQFALVPCKAVVADTRPPCVLLAAGGKYFLLGAPETALATLREDEIRLLDGVLLFSLLPEQIDGLDTVRHVTWKKGRSQPLLLGGPEGTKDFATAFDSAFEVPDAEFFTRESPAGGFDASLLQPVEVVFGRQAGTQIVDTGDLQITGRYAPSGGLVYLVKYGGIRIVIGMCGGDEDLALLTQLAESGFTYTCNDNGEIHYIIK